MRTVDQIGLDTVLSWFSFYNRVVIVALDVPSILENMNDLVYSPRLTSDFREWEERSKSLIL